MSRSALSQVLAELNELLRFKPSSGGA